MACEAAWVGRGGGGLCALPELNERVSGNSLPNTLSLPKVLNMCRKSRCYMEGIPSIQSLLVWYIAAAHGLHEGHAVGHRPVARHKTAMLYKTLFCSLPQQHWPQAVH